jgi:hypothetical protein
MKRPVEKGFYLLWAERPAIHPVVALWDGEDWNVQPIAESTFSHSNSFIYSPTVPPPREPAESDSPRFGDTLATYERRG